MENEYELKEDVYEEREDNYAPGYEDHHTTSPAEPETEKLPMQPIEKQHMVELFEKLEKGNEGMLTTFEESENDTVFANDDRSVTSETVSTVSNDNIFYRIKTIPLINSGIDKCSKYLDKHPLQKKAYDLVESALLDLNSKVASTDPYQFIYSNVSKMANKQLDYLETAFPVIKEEPEIIGKELQNLVNIPIEYLKLRYEKIKHLENIFYSRAMTVIQDGISFPTDFSVQRIVGNDYSFWVLLLQQSFNMIEYKAKMLHQSLLVENGIVAQEKVNELISNFNFVFNRISTAFQLVKIEKIMKMIDEHRKNPETILNLSYLGMNFLQDIRNIFNTKESNVDESIQVPETLMTVESF
jgi:hypothetical protein